MGEMWDASEIRATRDYLSKLPEDMLIGMADPLCDAWDGVPPSPATANTFRLACWIVDEMHKVAEAWADTGGLCSFCNSHNAVIVDGVQVSCGYCAEDGTAIKLNRAQISAILKSSTGKRWYHDAEWWVH